jgi:hypothetical protein
MNDRVSQTRRRQFVHWAILCFLSAILVQTGCQKVLPPKNEPVALIEDQVPLEIDVATQKRDFDKQTIYYPNGGAEAGSTRFPWGTRAKADYVEQQVMDPVLFVANSVSLPFTYFVKTPFSPYDWYGAMTEPSYTVQPAYPPETDEKTKTPTDQSAPPAENAAPTAAPQGVPPAQAPVPNPSEPVKEPSGDRQNPPAQNQGGTEKPGADTQ